MVPSIVQLGTQIWNINMKSPKLIFGSIGQKVMAISNIKRRFYDL